MNLLPMQPGDVPDTCADMAALSHAIGFQPTRRSRRASRFVEWYRAYYRVPA